MNNEHPMTIPEAPTTKADVRAVKMHRSTWEGDGMGLRTFDGRLITIDWREPDAEGWWEPWFTASGTTEAERVAAIRAESSAEIERWKAIETTARAVLLAEGIYSVAPPSVWQNLRAALAPADAAGRETWAQKGRRLASREDEA